MRLFLDSSTIIYNFEYEESNSAIIFNMILEGKFQGIINEKVIEEVRRYMIRRRDRQFAYLVESILRTNFEVHYLFEIENEMRKWEGKIKRKDLEHLATVKEFKIPYLIAFDVDFIDFEEYFTPKEFLNNLDIKGFNTDY